jgi:hypothetical protein
MRCLMITENFTMTSIMPDRFLSFFFLFDCLFFRTHRLRECGTCRGVVVWRSYLHLFQTQTQAYTRNSTKHNERVHLSHPQEKKKKT